MLFKTKKTNDTWRLFAQDKDWKTYIENMRTKEIRIVSTKYFNMWVGKGNIIFFPKNPIGGY